MGDNSEEDELATAEVLRSDSEEAEDHTFTALPPLSCGPRSGSIALTIDESESAGGQVLLLGGCGEDYAPLDVASMVVKVDLATGACTTPHLPLFLDSRVGLAAARLPDGRVVCAGGGHHEYREADEDGTCPASITAEVLEPPE